MREKPKRRHANQVATGMAPAIPVYEWSFGILECDDDGCPSGPHGPAIGFELLPTEGEPKHEGVKRVMVALEEKDVRMIAKQLAEWADELWPPGTN